MREFHKRYDYIINELLEFTELRGKQVVDCACGEGDGSIHFARAGCNVIGIDIDKKCIRTGRAAFPNITFYRRSILSTELDSELADVFVCSETLEHLTRKQSLQAAREIIRICKDQSYICVTVPDDKKTSLSKKEHLQYLSRKDIVDHFPGCNVIHDSVFYKNPKKKGNRVIILRERNV